MGVDSERWEWKGGMDEREGVEEEAGVGAMLILGLRELKVVIWRWRFFMELGLVLFCLGLPHAVCW